MARARMSAFLSFASCTPRVSLGALVQRESSDTHGEESTHGVGDHLWPHARVVDEVEVHHLLDLEHLDGQARYDVGEQRRHVLQHAKQHEHPADTALDERTCPIVMLATCQAPRVSARPLPRSSVAGVATHNLLENDDLALDLLRSLELCPQPEQCRSWVRTSPSRTNARRIGRTPGSCSS